MIKIGYKVLPAISSSECEVTGASAELANVESNLSLELDRLRIFALETVVTFVGDLRICEQTCGDCIEEAEPLVTVSQRSFDPEELFRELGLCFRSEPT